MCVYTRVRSPGRLRLQYESLAKVQADQEQTIEQLMSLN